MNLGRWSAVGCLTLVAAACAESPLPPEYQDLSLGMGVDALLSARPDTRPASDGRMLDPSIPASFRIIDGHVGGMRILVKRPASDALLVRYEDAFASKKVDGAPYSYNIGGHLLSLYSVKDGVELLYGVDPGSPTAAALQKAPKPKKAVAPRPSKGLPKLRIRRTSRPPQPAALPVSTNIRGVSVWSLRLARTTTSPVSLRLVVGLGASDEQPAGQGATAAIAELAVANVAEAAAKASVSVDARVLRTSTIFAVRGAGPAVAPVATALASQLARTRALTEAELQLGFTASLRQSMGADLDRYAIEDLALGAMFPNGPYTTQPVDRKRPPPRLEEVNARLSEVASAPLVIVAAGGVRERYAEPIAKAAGRRSPDDRQWRPKPALPNRTSKSVNNPSIAIDGVWLRASSPKDFAMLAIGEALLRRRATQLLRLEQGAGAAPFAVIGGGRSPASYLLVISIGAGLASESMDLAGRTAISGLAEAISREQAFGDVRVQARAALLRRLATPDDAADAMADLAMARARADWLPAILQRIDDATEPEVRRFLDEITREDHTFSVRWGPGS